jgi:hypothetical protein
VKSIPFVCILSALGLASTQFLANAQTPSGTVAPASSYSLAFQQPAAPAQKPSAPAYLPVSPVRYSNSLGSTYIPMDSWIYPAVMRLYSMGYVDTTFLGIRPWTRLSVLNMLEHSANKITDTEGNDEARELYLELQDELSPDLDIGANQHYAHASLDTVYTRLMGISGTPLNDSFHVGQTIINDYGRPYQSGFNNVTGFSARAEAGRFSLYYRGEYQHAPSAAGYSPAVAQILSTNDLIPLATNPNQATLPAGPIGSQDNLRTLEATLSYHILNHEVSFGKTDAWLGPAYGGDMIWSNNAESIYQFRIDRSEPLRIPLLSRITGPFRYEFLVGDLKGHTYPNSPWIHAEKVSFKPTPNLEFGFERTVIWGGKGHEPITIHTFLKSFFSFQNVSRAEKLSRNDPGARFGDFDFSYRLPFVRNWLTLYTDSEAHDDVSPISAPRRAGLRPGIYLSHVPGVPKLDFRVEGVTTDPPTSRSQSGFFLYTETIQKQGLTNKGFLLGDWVGRENKGGQAWLTYHLSPAEQIQISYRGDKAAKDFIPGGTTQNDISGNVVKRFGKDLEANVTVQYERWNVPLLKPGAQSDVTTFGQITWFPHRSY